jgi:hypothetical protein
MVDNEILVPVVVKTHKSEIPAILLTHEFNWRPLEITQLFAIFLSLYL